VLDMKLAHEGSEMCIQILQEDLKRRDHFAHIEVSLKSILHKYGVECILFLTQYGEWCFSW